MKALLTLAASAVIGLSASAIAADFAPAVIYDTAGKFDKSFNEDVFRNGAEQFVKDKGIQVREFEPQNEEQREQGLRRLASRGQSPIVAVGFSFGSSVEKVAAEFPDSQFVIIDSVVDLPNVQSIVFAEHEGSFLVGALAAMKSESGTAGFIGGVNIPLIQKFSCGFEQGFKVGGSGGQIARHTRDRARWRGGGAEPGWAGCSGVPARKCHSHGGRQGAVQRMTQRAHVWCTVHSVWCTVYGARFVGTVLVQ